MSGFDDSFGYGGYRKAGAEAPPPPPPSEIPLPPIYGPLKHILNAPPPGHGSDQQPSRLSLRISESTGDVAIVSGPGSESVVPLSLFSQMLIRMERLENENELLMRVIDELNAVLERERGSEFKVYEHPSVGTVTAPPAEIVAGDEDVVPPWRLKK
jgi:hypothetical protein